jgi:hypothetical protein
MAARRSGPLEVDQFCRRLGDQIQAAAACDDDAQCAAMLRTLAGYLRDKEIRIVQSAWDGPRDVAAQAPDADPSTRLVGREMRSKYPGRCAVCGEGISVGEPIIYDAMHRRAAHTACGEVAG